MTYQVPLQDMAFLAGDSDAPILTAAAKLAEQQWLPCNQAGDQQGCRLEGGQVRLADPIRSAWRHYAEAGWLGLTLPERWGWATAK